MSSSEHKASLSLSLGNTNRLALSIPVDQFPKYTNRPLKWLNYLGFVIAGRTGHLSTSSAGLEIEDYDAEIMALSYYFVLDGDPRLLDAQAMDGRTSVRSATSSAPSEHRASFMTNVEERDQNCIVTGDLPEFSEACHIIPHAKGSYNLSNHRSGAYESHEEKLDDINDIRNGLLLTPNLHKAFNRQQCAFLKTPSLYLTSRDVPSVTGKGNPVLRSLTAPRLTLQYFPSFRMTPTLSNSAPHNSNARLQPPRRINQRPSEMLLDMAYATAALKAWGSKAFIRYVRKEVGGIYYPPLRVGRGGRGGSGRDASSANRKSARTMRYEARSSNRRHTNQAKQRQQRSDDDMFDVVLTLWKLTAKEYGREHLRDTQAESATGSKSKVTEWLRSMEETS